MGDIYSNIVISAPQLTVDDAWKAAEIASIADDIREMPMCGMSTIISEGQGGISGGQRQRLMIARGPIKHKNIKGGVFNEKQKTIPLSKRKRPKF